MSKHELVLAIHRGAINQDVGAKGVFAIDLDAIPQNSYAFLPRHIADNKSIESIGLGAAYPQILGYVQIIDESTGNILSYARKGSEKGLHGMRSIGVGGHVSQDELMAAIYRSEDPSVLPPLTELLQLGLRRELEEEIGLDIGDFFEPNRLVISDWNKTSLVHVGLPMNLVVDPTQLDFDPSEFLDVQWLSPQELKDSIHLYEPWSQELIKFL